MSLLPRKGLLAIAAVVDVALNGRDRPVSAKALAARHGLPPRHLEPVLQALVHDGILFLWNFGDTIQVRLTCKSKTAKDALPDQIPQGVVAWDVEVSNQHAEPVHPRRGRLGGAIRRRHA